VRWNSNVTIWCSKSREAWHLYAIRTEGHCAPTLVPLEEHLESLRILDSIARRSRRTVTNMTSNMHVMHKVLFQAFPDTNMWGPVSACSSCLSIRPTFRYGQQQILRLNDRWHVSCKKHGGVIFGTCLLTDQTFERIFHRIDRESLRKTR
jgi:hypothetical protein